MNKEQEITIIIMSCDKYSDLWSPFSILFNKYWPDCPYKTMLVTETAAVNNKGLCFDEYMNCGKNTGWAERLKMCLSRCNSEYVIMLCDDYFLCDRVDNVQIERYLNIVKQENLAELRMCPGPKPKEVYANISELGLYPKGMAYRITTQPGIWKREYLYELAEEYKSIWEFERKGSYKSNELDGTIVGTFQWFFPYEDVLQKGKWEGFGIRLCSRNNIEIDFTKHPKMKSSDMAKEYLKGAILEWNPELIVKIQNKLNLGKK